MCPSQFVIDSSGYRVLNPAYETWCKRDQILMIWINTLYEDLLPLTVSLDDSRSLWQSLERRFSGASHTHIHSLRSKIQTIQKGDSSMTDYLNSLKEISDKLEVAENRFLNPILLPVFFLVFLMSMSHLLILWK